MNLPGGVRRDFPVDGHVHFHRLDRVGSTLDAAATNFTRAASQASGLLGAVLLVETSGERVFEPLRELREFDGWSFAPSAVESCAVTASRGKDRIAVISGQQIRCEGGLEVLALGTSERFPDGKGLEETIEEVRNAGTLVSVPWGFGKWTGKRGARVRELFRRADPTDLFVGDNGGRIEWLGLPRLVREASEAGFRVLPGTDPFPCGGDERRVGAFGFYARIEPEEQRPWGCLRGWLESRRTSPPAYGGALNPLRFAYNQLGIRVTRRVGSGS